MILVDWNTVPLNATLLQHIGSSLMGLWYENLLYCGVREYTQQFHKLENNSIKPRYSSISEVNVYYIYLRENVFHLINQIFPPKHKFFSMLYVQSLYSHYSAVKLETLALLEVSFGQKSAFWTPFKEWKVLKVFQS